MTQNDVRIENRQTVYAGYVRVERYRLRHRLHRGGMSGPLTREVVARGHSVGLLPYDPGRDRVVLVEQFRIGAFAANRAAWTVEVVAGIVEPEESAEQVARREALEETGCAVAELEPIGRCLLSPGVLSEEMTLFCGRVDAAEIGGVHGVAGEGEDIRAFALPWADAAAAMAARRIATAPALLALQWLALNRDRLRARWR